MKKNLLIVFFIICGCSKKADDTRVYLPALIERVKGNNGMQYKASCNINSCFYYDTVYNYALTLAKASDTSLVVGNEELIYWAPDNSTFKFVNRYPIRPNTHSLQISKSFKSFQYVHYVAYGASYFEWNE